MTTLTVRNGSVAEEQIAYFENRARGGAAMIITEPLSMSPMQAVPTKTHVFNPDNAAGLTRMAKAVEQHDCRILGQIQDPGRARHHAGRHLNAIAPSVLPDDMSWSVPRALTVEEIAKFVKDFAQSAARLQSYGFSGVELSCGHGHLFHQFMSPQSNIRDDAYGGNWENRCRFVREIVTAIRLQCGANFIIGLKLPGDDGLPGGIGPEQAIIVAKILTESQEASYVCFAQGTHANSLEMHIPDRFGPRTPYRALINTLRQAIPQTPVMSLGRISDPAEAEAILASGEAELIGIGRALIADPAWPLKVAQSRINEIRYCLACNTCWDTIITRHEPLACVNNPRVRKTDEVDYWPTKATETKRITIVGAGIAGMEAAWIAAARGHQVTVLGSGAQIGGKAWLRTHFPGGEEVSSVYDYQTVAALRGGVQIKLGVTATVSEVMRLTPDVVILATGATMIPPSWLPAEVHNAGLVQDLRETMAGLLGVSSKQSGTAVIFDTDHTEGTYAMAERLHELFERVVILTPRHSLADDMAVVTRQGVLRRLYTKKIDIHLLALPVWTDEVENGILTWEHVITHERHQINDVALVTYSTPRKRNDALAAPLSQLGIEVVLVGDCKSPRDMIAATSDGHQAGHFEYPMIKRY
jgi:2,4-dienoyl-CoA reductase-like NADH-dependent reductase (Old Yellow Enzyme family)